jgi:hypothetical protein
MLNLISKTTIIQQPNKDFPSRAKSFIFDFVTSGQVSSTWQNLTDTAKLTFPKNIYFKDETGNNYTWQGKNVIGGNSTPPLIMRGDKITIEWGYYYNKDENYNYLTQTNVIFEGYISKVVNRIPIEIEAEDNMWKLKQIAAPNKVYPASQFSLQTMLNDMLSGTGFTVKTSTVTGIGDFRPQNETVAQVLDRLQRDYRIESYFRGNELRCSGIVYYPDFIEKTFQFQQNIISDELEYRRLDDINIGIKAYSINEAVVGGKKKKQRIEAFITNKGETNEAGFEGEKRTVPFIGISSKDELIKAATPMLNRFYYEGFYGSFDSFGFPFVRHGDHAILRDPVLPERNGTYKIKAVTYDFGVETAYRQKIEVDMRVDGLTTAQLQAGL